MDNHRKAYDMARLAIEERKTGTSVDGERVEVVIVDDVEE